MGVKVNGNINGNGSSEEEEDSDLRVGNYNKDKIVNQLDKKMSMKLGGQVDASIGKEEKEEKYGAKYCAICGISGCDCVLVESEKKEENNVGAAPYGKVPILQGINCYGSGVIGSYDSDGGSGSGSGSDSVSSIATGKAFDCDGDQIVYSNYLGRWMHKGEGNLLKKTN